MESSEVLRNEVKQRKTIKNCFEKKNGAFEFEPVKNTKLLKISILSQPRT